MTYKRYVELCVGYNLIYVFILKLLMSLSKAFFLSCLLSNMSLLNAPDIKQCKKNPCETVAKLAKKTKKGMT